MIADDHKSRRRGTIAVISGLSLVLLVGMMVLAVDISMLVDARWQLQAGVDHCATSTAFYIVNQGVAATPEQRQAISAGASVFGQNFMPVNPVESIVVDADEVVTGLAIWDESGRVIGLDVDDELFNAVQVTTSMNGSQILPAIFGRVLGTEYYSPSATAIALLNIESSAYWPFAVHWLDWEYFAEVNGPDSQDNWGWDAEAEIVTPGGDGTPEVRIFPHNNFAYPSDCPGNFGQLNIDSDNQGLPYLVGLVLYGISSEQLLNAGIDAEALAAAFEVTGQLIITSNDTITAATSDFSPVQPGMVIQIGQGTDAGFYLISSVPDANTLELSTNSLTPTAEQVWFRVSANDGAGQSPGFPAGGNSGMSNGSKFKNAVLAHIGDTVGIFTHNSCNGSGANLTYHLVGIRFGRVMHADFTGNDKGIFIQPTTPPTLVEPHFVFDRLGM